MRNYLEKFHDAFEDRQEVFPILNAGGQRNFTAEHQRIPFLSQIEIAVNNGAHTCVIFAHEDCGAYGGSGNFQNLADERQTYVNDVNTIARYVESRFAGKLKIQKVMLMRKPRTEDFSRFETIN